ncbi:MAG: TCR/Tet family MFS transporter, partial [Candidatus Moranbacteria bacterium]|nr:TCR/Tet family MFS transporter [Candidatus Moranbacteria bacterium]
FEKVKAIIILTVLIDVIGLGIIIPVLPYYVESFGVSSFVVSLLFATFALFSFVSGPFLGALSDRIGRRPVLIASIVSTAIGWFVFAWANSIWILFLGRIIDGAAAGNFPIAQSYLIDIAKNDKERTTNLGIIGAVFGIGFIIGPVIGATLSAISPSLPFLSVGILAAINAIGAYFFLPETHNEREKNPKKIAINPLLPILRGASDKLLRSRYLVWLLFGIAFAGMQSIFALYTKEIFGFSALLTGYIFTGMGIVLFFNQTVGLNKFWLKYFKDRQLEIWLFLIMAAGFVLMDVQKILFFAFGLFFVTMAQSTLRVILSSTIAGSAGNMRRGEVMGIMSSVMSISMIVGPLLAGALFAGNYSWPFLMNVALLFVAFIIMKNCDNCGEIVQHEDVEVLG